MSNKSGVIRRPSHRQIIAFVLECRTGDLTTVDCEWIYRRGGHDYALSENGEPLPQKVGREWKRHAKQQKAEDNGLTLWVAESIQ